MADVTQSLESLVEVVGFKYETEVIVMTAVAIGKTDHLGVFLASLGEVGIEGLDVVLSGFDFLIQNGDLLIVSLDEALALAYFLVEDGDLVERHFLVARGFFQQLVGGRDFFLQRSDFILQLGFRLPFGLLWKSR